MSPDNKKLTALISRLPPVKATFDAAIYLLKLKIKNSVELYVQITNMKLFNIHMPKYERLLVMIEILE